MKYSALITAAAITLSVLLAPIATAVEYGGVGGRPANPRNDNDRTKSIFIYTIEPGETKSDGVRVFNNTDKKRTLAIQAVDAVLASGGAFSCAQQAEQRKDVGAWIKLKTNQVSLDAGKSAVVPFTITAPGGAEVGEHDGCITIQDTTATSKTTDGSGITLGFRSAIRVVATIPGEVVKKLSIEDVSISRTDEGNYTVSPTVRNDGNVSLDTDVVVEFRSLFGATASQNKGTYPILPRSDISWNFEVRRPFWGGWYYAKVNASYNSDPTSLLGEKNGNIVTKSKRSAIIFVPPTLAAAIVEILLALGAAAVSYLWFRRRREMKHMREHWRNYVVKEGETINQIAQSHNTSWQQIARVNRIAAPYTLTKGQKLKVPAKARQTR